MNMKESTVKFIELNGFKELTKIQEACIRMAAKDKDIVAISKTGTGKTHAFLIPVMEKIDLQEDNIQVVISAPTRELAMQIYSRAKLMSEAMSGLRIRLLSGGLDSNRMKESLKQLPHIIIGTPGKIRDLYVNNVIRVDKVKMFIIDEADMTLEYGFLEDIDVVFASMKSNPEIMCFSATLPEGLKPFIKKYLSNPQIIRVEDNEEFNPKIEHILINCKHKSYDEALLDILGGFNPYVCLIFANTREECSKTALILKKNGYKVLELHGGLESRERQKAMKALASKEYTYVVASDVASRGIDVDGVSHVVSLGFPSDLSFYTHRAGRTGRNGREGVCFALYNENDLKAIDTLTKQGINFVPKSFRNGEWRILKPLNFKRVSRSEIREKEIAKTLNRKNEKVKPNYKKKKTQAINRIKQKERQAYIRQKIKEEKKARYKANHKEY